MSGSSTIEWTDATWNPTIGCSVCSPGCDHCYAMTQAPRQAGKGLYDGVVENGQWTGRINLGDATQLDWPLRKTKPLRIFVNSMSDLFHPEIPEEFIADVFARMSLASWHTFQVLTKRPQRMAAVTNSSTFQRTLLDKRDQRAGERDVQRLIERDVVSATMPWPLPNVWLGTSIETQRYAFRAAQLLDAPAQVHFVSAEPLLGPLDLSDYMSVAIGGLDWLIVGGESGRGARPMHPQWARSLRDQCIATHVPFLFKQWGSHGPMPSSEPGCVLVQTSGAAMIVQSRDGDDMRVTPRADLPSWQQRGRYSVMLPMDKHEAGRMLDGRTWDEYPS